MKKFYSSLIEGKEKKFQESAKKTKPKLSAFKTLKQSSKSVVLKVCKKKKENKN